MDQRVAVGVPLPPHLLGIDVTEPENVGPLVPSPEEMERMALEKAEKNISDVQKEWLNLQNSGKKTQEPKETLQREEWMLVPPEQNRAPTLSTHVQSQTSFRMRQVTERDTSEWTTVAGEQQTVSQQKISSLELARRMARENAARLRNEQMQSIVEKQEEEQKLSLLEQHLLAQTKQVTEDKEKQLAKKRKLEEAEKKKEKKDKKHQDKKHKDKKHRDKKHKKDKDKKHKKDTKDEVRPSKKRKLDEEKSKFEPYWDRERDLSESRINPEKRAAAIKDSAVLNSKFESSKFL